MSQPATQRGQPPASKANLNLWKPGQSGNPKGRPRDNDSLMLRVRQATNQGHDIVAFLVSVLTGTATGGVKLGGRGSIVYAPPSLPDRLHAAEILLDRGWGKPLAEVKLSGQVDHQHSLASWTIEELEALAAMRTVLMEAGYQPPELEAGEVVEGELAEPHESPLSSDENRREVGGYRDALER